MYPREMGGSSNHNPGVSKKSMEKTTSSLNQPARDRVKLSDKSTPENLGSVGRGVRSGDRASTSDGSGLQYDNHMLNLMQTIMRKEQDTADQLKQANQNILELIQERDNLKNTLSSKLKEALWGKEQLANQLEQANRKIEELANQLKQANSSETSSLIKHRKVST